MKLLGGLALAIIVVAILGVALRDAREHPTPEQQLENASLWPLCQKALRHLPGATPLSWPIVPDRTTVTHGRARAEIVVTTESGGLRRRFLCLMERQDAGWAVVHSRELTL